MADILTDKEIEDILLLVNYDIVFQFDKQYTDKPCARDETHDTDVNGKDFRINYLEDWIKNKLHVLIKVDNLELPFSDCFVDESFVRMMETHYQEFFEYIKIDDKTQDEKELHETIKAVMKHKAVTELEKLRKFKNKRKTLYEKVIENDILDQEQIDYVLKIFFAVFNNKHLESGEFDEAMLKFMQKLGVNELPFSVWIEFRRALHENKHTIDELLKEN